MTYNPDMKLRRPTTYEEIRAKTDRERGALIAANVLPHLPKTDYLLILRAGKRPSSPNDGPQAPKGHRNAYRHFEEKERPIAPGVNLYRVQIDDHISNRSGLRIVEPVPHADFGRYSLHVDDFVALQRPFDPREWDYTREQTTFGTLRKVLGGNDYPRKSRLPI